MLNKAHKFNFIALMEPFQNASVINKYRRRLGMPFAKSNFNGKIWIFVKEGYQVDINLDAEQHITIKVQDTILNKDFFVTLVYAKCDGVQRRALWEDIYQLHNSMGLLWIIGGDFNVVLNAEEKLGGLVV